MESLPRRTIVVALSFVTLLGAGCARKETPAPRVKGGDGLLRLSFPTDPRTLNPNVSPLDEHALFIAENIFSKLVSLADDGTVLPDLAERWTESEDGLEYTFYLRQGVRWHDGRPLTTEDVRSTFAQIGTSSNAELASRVAGVEAVDPTTVRIRLKAPWAAFITNVAWYGASILPAHVYGTSAWSDHPANMQPIGSGPFKLVAWERGRRILLEKNVEYFGQGPYVDGVEYTIVSSEDGVQRLLDRQSDLLFGRPPLAMIPKLSRTPGIRVSTRPSDGRTYLAFNMRRAPFNDLRARRAVNLAIDRRPIVDDVLAGLGMPAVGFYIPSIAWAYNGNARVPAHDRAEARRLFAEVIPRGTRITLAMPARASGPSRLGRELLAQLSAAGLAVDLKTFDFARYSDVVLRTHDFDIALMTGAQGPDPDTLFTRFASTGSMQVMGYENPELDRQLARGARQTDPVVRAQAYHRAQEILAADLPIAPLYDGVEVAVYRDGLRGLPQEDARGLVPFSTYNLVRLPGAR